LSKKDGKMPNTEVLVCAVFPSSFKVAWFFIHKLLFRFITTKFTASQLLKRNKQTAEITLPQKNENLSSKKLAMSLYKP